MAFRALAIATCTAALMTAPAFAASYDYLFSITETQNEPDDDRSVLVFSGEGIENGFESNEGPAEVTVEGFLSFSSISTTEYVAPDTTRVDYTSLGDDRALGVYSENEKGGFKFTSEGKIIDANYQVEKTLSDDTVEQLKFVLSFDRGRESRHVLSCMDLYELDQEMCVDNPFAPAIDTSIQIEYTRITDVPAVPLPAGFPLMLVGMAGFAALRARRKSS